MLFAQSRGRPRLLIAAAVAAVVVVLGLMLLLQRPATAQQETPTLEAQAQAALDAWWGALVAGSVDGVAAVLAPEFQIMRADASGYDRAGYLASALPNVAALPEITGLVATGHGEHLVTRYLVTVNETRDGQVVEAHAPRLTVFRREAGAWLVVAHGNFATLEDAAL